MLRLSVILFAGFFLANAQGQPGAPIFPGRQLGRAADNPARSSASGQFVILPPVRTGWLPSLGVNSNLVRLDPTLLAISCEKIKVALKSELGAPRDQWRGRIEVALHPAVSLDETIQINSTRFVDGWHYRVELPDAIERGRLVTVVIEVLLREMANRNAGHDPVDIPAWLAEGLSRQLLLDSITGLILDPPTGMENGLNLTRVNALVKKQQPLAGANERLRDKPPMSLAELSWAQHDQFVGAAGEIYRDNAQLLVCGLERLPDGRACLLDFLRESPGHLNWQIAFLSAFRGHFRTQLDFDKWWELTLMHFTGHDMAQAWSSDDSWRKLDEVIRPPVQVRMAVDEIPLRTEVTLQTIIREWDNVRQSQVFAEKLGQLQMLRAHVSRDLTPVVDPRDPEKIEHLRPGPRDLLPLVEAYRQVLENYMQNRSKTGSGRVLNGMALPRAHQAEAEALRELDALDARREELRPRAEPEDQAKKDSSEITSAR